MTEKPHRIDVHQHIIPPAFRATAEESYRKSLPGASLPPWSVEQALEIMDRHGVATGITSVLGGVWLGEAEASRKIARVCNEFAAQMSLDYPGRFGSFASLPLPDIGGGLAEIEYAFDVLAADGIVLRSNYDDLYLGDARFSPVFDELNRRKAVVYLHPTGSTRSLGIQPEIPAFGPAAIELAFDLTRAIASLLFSGTFERCPEIRFIVYSAGGTLPYLAQRLNFMGSLNPNLAKSVPQGVMHYLQRLYYDSSGYMIPVAFPSLLRVVTPAQILFGSDVPTGPESMLADVVKDLAEYGFAEADLYAIERGNALRLFPRLAAL